MLFLLYHLLFQLIKYFTLRLDNCCCSVFHWQEYYKTWIKIKTRHYFKIKLDISQYFVLILAESQQQQHPSIDHKTLINNNNWNTQCLIRLQSELAKSQVNKSQLLFQRYIICVLFSPRSIPAQILHLSDLWIVLCIAVIQYMHRNCLFLLENNASLQYINKISNAGRYFWLTKQSK